MKELALFTKACLFYLCALVLVITIPWDTLAWLTNNQGNWKNTHFLAGIICIIILIVLTIISFLTEIVYNIRQALIGALEMEKVRASEGNPSKFRGIKKDKKKQMVGMTSEQKYLWANRLPPYDND